MKRRWRLSVFSLCLVAAAAVWLLLDVRVMTSHDLRSYFIQTTTQGQYKHTDIQSNPPKGTKFHNILNRTAGQPGSHPLSHPGLSAAGRASTPPPPPTTAPSPVDTTTTTAAVRGSSVKHVVAVVSYMRSGSTLTADILQHFPGTVYVFEPLHMLFGRVRDSKPIYYLNGTKRHLTPADLTDQFVSEELHKWFSCRYTELDVHSLADNFHATFSRSMKKIIDCWRPKRHTLKSMRECVPGAVRMCENARHRLFKFIRLRMRILEPSLRQFPNLQIIHLVRDPRGSLTSEMNIRGRVWSGIENKSVERCAAQSEDLNYTFSFMQTYPDRIRILNYERLATNPIDMAKRLFGFLGLPPYDYVLRYISKLTSEGRKDGHAFQIIRGNSTKTAYSWRYQANITDVQLVDEVCADIYSILGYMPMATQEDLINEAIPTFITPKLPGLL